MKWPEPRAFAVDIGTGLMTGSPTRYQKKLKHLAGLYADEAAFEALAQARGEEIVYEVTDHKPSDAPGDLITGVTRMSPGQVGDEFFMTRGHIHAVTGRPELYFGLKGRGLMLLESPDGESRVIEVAPHTVCYVPPFWIHRSVNTGRDDLVMLFCYPADSGQDYAIIERAKGMKQRIVSDGLNGWRSVENPRYVPRTAPEVDTVLAAKGAQA